MNAYIFHGTEGSPQENWFQWLKEELEKDGIETEVPQLPDSAHPDMNKWLTEVANLEIGSDTILIGHSLGAVLALRMLERGHKAKAVYLVAPFLHDLGWDVLKDSLFFADTFDWSLVKKQCDTFEVFASKNDPHLSIEDVGAVAEGLGVENQVIDINKHFNVTEFPYLLKRIQNLV